MEGAWKLNPFYWIALRRMKRANNYIIGSNQGLTLSPQNNGLGNFWSSRAFRVSVVSLLAIILPIYAYAYSQVEAKTLADSADQTLLEMPEINLSTPVEAIDMIDRQLIAPDTIAGVYTPSEHKTFIIGHSSTVFENLEHISLASNFHYNGENYVVISIDTREKSDIDMAAILAPTEDDTIILMTCAGEPLPNQDATHRLIVTAVREPNFNDAEIHNSGNQDYTVISSEQE